MSMNKKTRSLINTKYESQRIYYQRREIKKKDKQIQELTNNWNELEKWLQNEYNEWSDVEDEIIRAEARQCIEVLDKMKEIEEGDNE